MKKDVVIRTPDRFVRDPVYEQKVLRSSPQIPSHNVIAIDSFANFKNVCI
jgi:hypothetical protein